MSEEREAGSVGFLERKLASVWGQLAPLSAGAVLSGVAIVAGRGLLRRLIGRKSSGLGWAGTVALVPFGLLLLGAAREVRQARPAPAEEASTAEEKETVIIAEE